MLDKNDLKQALGQRCHTGTNEYILNWWERIWYTFKILICQFLMLDLSDNVCPYYYDMLDNSISVYITNSGVQKGTSHGNDVYWYGECRVGRGVFGNWWYVWTTDSSD